MHTTKTIKNFTELELQKGIKPEASWHNDYKDSSYIFTGGLHFDMNEGDIAIVFSQYGEIVDVHLVRDKKTGKSRGFSFVSYEDQRSTVLAVDNLNNAEVCGRTIRVDHVKKYRPPREYLEVKDEDTEFFDKIYKPSGPDGKGWGEYRTIDEEERRLRREAEESERNKTNQTKKLLDDLSNIRNAKIDEDERWELKLMKKMEDELNQEKQKFEQEKLLKKEKKRLKKEKKEKKMQKAKNKEKKKLDEERRNGRNTKRKSPSISPSRKVAKQDHKPSREGPRHDKPRNKERSRSPLKQRARSPLKERSRSPLRRRDRSRSRSKSNDKRRVSSNNRPSEKRKFKSKDRSRSREARKEAVNKRH